MWSRRDFLTRSALAAGALVAPRATWAHWRPGMPEPIGDPLIEPADPRLAALAERALAAARENGARYADVRLTYTRSAVYELGNHVGHRQTLHIGVRALVGGYWGFASSPFWSPDAAAHVGHSAATFARDNTQGPTRTVELAPVPAVRNGNWVQPLTRDPFDVSAEEVFDWVTGASIRMDAVANQDAFPAGIDTHLGNRVVVSFDKQLLVFASTEGNSFTRTCSRTTPTLTVETLAQNEPWPIPSENMIGRGGDLMYLLETHQLLPPALHRDAGWSAVQAIPIGTLVDLAFEEVNENLRLPVKPVEVGRYEAVLDWASMGSLLNATLGQATELDRALGFEANAGGTSYLGPDPRQQLGTAVAAPSVTVTGNRTAAGELASVPWDDEGVPSEPFTLVKNGILVDYQTTRESATWLADHYAQQHRPVRSSGCAAADTASNISMAHQPNLHLEPDPRGATLPELMGRVSHGLLLQAGSVVSIDQQALNGMLLANGLYEIRNGKKVARIGGGGVLFRSPELWNGIQALGGPDSARWLDGRSSKGEPEQRTWCTMSAVPALHKELTLVDLTRQG